MPELDAVATEMAGTPVRFLAVSLQSDTRRVRVAVETLKLRLPVATSESEVLGPLGLDNVPATIFVDASGHVVSRLATASKADLKSHAQQLLRDSTVAARGDDRLTSTPQ
ncbi:MAG: TlpA family protein disulfide reductase [Myxococcaceae bacterium]